jgi:hypothetical protein
MHIHTHTLCHRVAMPCKLFSHISVCFTCYGMTIYVRKPDSTQLVWTSFLTPFSTGVCLCLIASLLWLSTALLQHEITVVTNKHRAREGPLLQFCTVTLPHATLKGCQLKGDFGLHPKHALCNLLFTQFRINGAYINRFQA